MNGKGNNNDFGFDTESVYPTVSKDIVKHLQKQGLTLRQIGQRMGLSESFISRVLNGKRSFTLKHLQRLEKAQKRPLPLILLESADPDGAPPEYRSLYEAFRGVIAALGGVNLGTTGSK